MKNLPQFGVSHFGEIFGSHRCLDVDCGARADGIFQLQSEGVGHLKGGLTYKNTPGHTILYYVYRLTCRNRPGKLAVGNSNLLNARLCCEFPGGTSWSR